MTPDKDAAMTQEQMTDDDFLNLMRLAAMDKGPLIDDEQLNDLSRAYGKAEAADDMATIPPYTLMLLLSELRRHRAAAEPKEDMRERAKDFATRCDKDIGKIYSWMFEKLVDSLAREFTLISTEATRKERERAAGIARGWLDEFAGYSPSHVSANKWANEAVRDIESAIRTPEEER